MADRVGLAKTAFGLFSSSRCSDRRRGAAPNRRLPVGRTWLLILSHARKLKRPHKGAFLIGGQGGIRTHDTLAGMPHFECGAIDHSTTCPPAVIKKPCDQGKPFC